MVGQAEGEHGSPDGEGDVRDGRGPRLQPQPEPHGDAELADPDEALQPQGVTEVDGEVEGARQEGLRRAGSSPCFGLPLCDADHLTFA